MLSFLRMCKYLSYINCVFNNRFISNDWLTRIKHDIANITVLFIYLKGGLILKICKFELYLKFQNLFSANIKTDKVLLVEVLLWARHTDARQAFNKDTLLDNDNINNTSLSTHGTIYIQSIIKLSQNSGPVLQKVVGYKIWSQDQSYSLRPF